MGRVNKPPAGQGMVRVEWPKEETRATKYWLAQLAVQPPGWRPCVYIAKARWRVDQDYRELKDELRLDHYEGRQWRGRHYHVVLVSMAYAFLSSAQARIKKTSGATWTLPRVRKDAWRCSSESLGVAYGA